MRRWSSGERTARRGWLRLPTLFAVFLFACHSGTPAAGLPTHEAGALAGAWRDVADAGFGVRFEGGRLWFASAGQIHSVARIGEITGSRLRLCEHGRDTVREVSWDGGDLVLRNPQTGESRRFRRLGEVPPDLVLRPLPLAAPANLSSEEVAQVQHELWQRLQRDQTALRDASGGLAHKGQPWAQSVYNPQQDWGTVTDLRLLDVVTGNTRYLRELVSRIGWIDAGRFGYAASNAAFLLVQHSGDLPLMMAALPEIKKDVDAGRLDGQTYALLFDRLQLSLGERQLYGSQVGTDPAGEAWLLPVDQPEGLDVRRKALGMSPILEYLRVFGATEVKISTACEGPAG